MYLLSPHKHRTISNLLVEANSIRSAERITGVMTELRDRERLIEELGM
jgi:hypothetical protein